MRGADAKVGVRIFAIITVRMELSAYDKAQRDEEAKYAYSTISDTRISQLIIHVWNGWV